MADAPSPPGAEQDTDAEELDVSDDMVAVEDRPSADPNQLFDNQSDARADLTLQALGLLNEQLQARVVHYRGDLETSPELDAVTQRVIEQLRAMQAVVDDGSERLPPERIEQEQIRTMSKVLTRLMPTGGASPYVSSCLKSVGKKLLRLFFQSELHERTKGDRDKIIRHSEQGVYYVLQRYAKRIRAELDAFEYESDEVRQNTFATLDKIEQTLKQGFLARRSPELKKVLDAYTTVLTEFLTQHLPPRLEAISRNTIRSARTAYVERAAGYKVLPESFPAFRREWERQLMQQLVYYCGDRLAELIASSNDEVREETRLFFTDAHLFSETGQVLCDALYEHLCLEGFLDLPTNWQMAFARE